MKIINGKYTSAVIYTTQNKDTDIDDYAAAQLKMLCDNPINKNSKFRIMPDVHAGKVGPIGLTQTVSDAIMPNIVGIDIGCGISMAKIKAKSIEFQKLDKVITSYIPTGFRTREDVHHLASEFDFSKLKCLKHIRQDKALLSLGTLGSGNHFIELDKDGNGDVYLTVHSGSRHLGKEVTEHYLKLGQKHLKEKGIEVPYELTYLTEKLMYDYIHDIQIIQDFAKLNKEIITYEICKRMKWKVIEQYDCIHNYVETSDTSMLDAAIIRKGAISAKKDELVIIPINMKDGIIIGQGLGNKDWNFSAPHGAGRIMKREDMRNSFSVSMYKKEMIGIYSPSISNETLDEAPFAYRGIDEIAEAIKDTVKIEKVIKPIYNFKDRGE